jgi:hypothetical protein
LKPEQFSTDDFKFIKQIPASSGHQQPILEELDLDESDFRLKMTNVVEVYPEKCGTLR